MSKTNRCPAPLRAGPAARVVRCKWVGRYGIGLCFADGLRGVVGLNPLVEMGAFRALRDERVFATVRLDAETGDICWPIAGLRLQYEALYQQIAAARGGFVSWEEVPKADAGFQRFMARVIGGRA